MKCPRPYCGGSIVTVAEVDSSHLACLLCGRAPDKDYIVTEAKKSRCTVCLLAFKNAGGAAQHCTVVHGEKPVRTRKPTPQSRRWALKPRDKRLVFPRG